ncbi:MAG: glycosyl hydrolase 53 family protein [Bacteroidales bacterium]
MRRMNCLLLCCLMGWLAMTCGKDDPWKPDPGNGTDTTAWFAKGADVSWITEMEAGGIKFYDANGSQTECMTLLKKTGMNAIRLRVWVNPADGWCNKTDLLVKAKRAHDLDMRLMIDFHYSDWWADPGKQNKPAAWADIPFNELCSAVADHTTEVLTALKNWNITPEWVQVGNETGNGMLWDEGKASENMAQYAALNNAGYDAVKAVFPDARVIVHLQNGQTNSLYRWLFDGLKNNGGKWDVIGMSLYPEPGNWLEFNNNIIGNINDMVRRYGSEVMICEVGMSWNEAVTAELFLSDLINRTKAIPNKQCLGVFYWEPQAYNGWKAYTKGAFDDSGKPTVALDAFN